MMTPADFEGDSHDDNQQAPSGVEGPEGIEAERQDPVLMTQPATEEFSAADLDRLFEEHGGRILRVAHRVTGNRTDAEDVLQTIFFRLLNREGGVELGPGVGSYLHRAAVNAGLDLLRSRKRARAVPLEVDGEPIDYEETHPDSQAETRVQNRELRDSLRLALTKLNPRAAEVFSLRYLEGYGNTEIAELLGTSRSSIAVTLHRSRARLKEELGATLGAAS